MDTSAEGPGSYFLSLFEGLSCAVQGETVLEVVHLFSGALSLPLLSYPGSQGNGKAHCDKGLMEM